MLQLKNIKIVLKKDGRFLADGFSFTLEKGDRAVIIGEEGNGKSTLLRFIYDPGSTDSYCETEGEVITDCKMAYLPQVPDKRDFGKTLAEYFEGKEHYRYSALLAKLGIDIKLLASERRFGTLSGGEKVKVQLAKLCMEEPDIFLLDEPANDLDIPALRWLEDFISCSGSPVIFVSHDETLIENTANVIIHMEQLIRKTQCKITVAHCGYIQYAENRRSSFEHQDMVAQKQRDEYKKQMEKWRRIYSRVEYEQRSITRQDPAGGRLLKKKMHSVKAMEKRLDRKRENFVSYSEQEDAIIVKFDEDISVPSGKTVLEYSSDVLCAGGRVLARDIRLFVRGGEHIGITGKNGAGKTTLLNLIFRYMKEKDLFVLGYMPQNYEELLDYAKTPLQHFAENYSKEEMTEARTLMGSMRFTGEEMTGPIGNLSGGQKAKILFLDMVMKRAEVLLLDEPTRNFSPLSGPVIRAALRDFKGGIISISHDRKYLSEVCDTVYELGENGLRRVNLP